MPQKVGVYTYTWSFSDGSSSGNGSFSVNDSGQYSGLLVRDGKYFKSARGENVDVCSYGHIVTTTPPGYSSSYDNEYVAYSLDATITLPADTYQLT